MKTNMENIDKLIKESLSKEEAEFYDSLEQQNVFGMMGGMYKGRMGGILVILSICQVVAFGFAVYCAIKFFNAEQTDMLIKWGIGFVILITMVSFIKTYSWMHMNKQAIIRELKRIEYQLSILSSKGL